MEIRTSQETKTSFKELQVIHKEELLSFDARSKVYCGNTETNLFHHTNEFISSLDESKQTKLFNLYKQAKAILKPDYRSTLQSDKELLKNHGNYRYLIKRLTPIVQSIYELIDVRNLCYYARQSDLINPPPELKETVERGEYHPSQTVNPTEYTHIAELTIILKPLLPIFSQTVAVIKETVGKDYTYVVVGELVKELPFLNTHPGWLKVREYMTYFLSVNTGAIQLDIIAEDSLAEHAFYYTLFDRLCVSHVPTVDSYNLAKCLYSVAKKFSSGTSGVREKTVIARDDQNDKNSQWEVYFLKEETASGDEVAHAEYFSMGMFDNTDKPIHKDRFKYPAEGLGIKNPELVEWVYDLIPTGWNYTLTRFTMKLLELTFMGDISPKIYIKLDYHQLTAALCLASVKLHEEGYPVLATLIFAVWDPEGTRSSVDDLFSLNSEEKTKLEEICEIYRGQAKLSTDNEAVISATEFFKDVGNGQWCSIIESGMYDVPEYMSVATMGDTYPIELNRQLKTEFLNLVFNRNS